MNQKILVVDDDAEIRELIEELLEQHHFAVFQAADTKEMDEVLSNNDIDLITLDLMMPGEDGLSICRRLRSVSEYKSIPVIMLTAMGEEADKIVGLEMGADDYLAKPFSSRELLARIKALLRRAYIFNEGLVESQGEGVGDEPTEEIYKFEGWSFDPQRRILIDKSGVQISLSTGEYDVLMVFVTHPQHVLSRDQLLDLARGRSAVLFDRSMDVQISRLRKKLGDDWKKPRLIQTIRGGGYKFAVPVKKEIVTFD